MSLRVRDFSQTQLVGPHGPMVKTGIEEFQKALDENDEAIISLREKLKTIKPDELIKKVATQTEDTNFLNSSGIRLEGELALFVEEMQKLETDVLDIQPVVDRVSLHDLAPAQVRQKTSGVMLVPQTGLDLPLPYFEHQVEKLVAKAQVLNKRIETREEALRAYQQPRKNDDQNSILRKIENILRKNHEHYRALCNGLARLRERYEQRREHLTRRGSFIQPLGQTQSFQSLLGSNLQTMPQGLPQQSAGNNLFGQQSQGGGMFGGGQSSGGGLFGGGGGGMFGGGQSSGGGLFGGGGGGGGMFGGGQSSGGSLFGGGGGGMFGGGQSSGGSLFGGGGGGIFGGGQSSSGGGIFGGQQSQGGSLFGGQQSQGGGLFGGGQQSQGGGLFGQQSQGGGLFGGQQSQGGGLFGGQQSQGGGLFGGQQSQSGGLFGGQQSQSGGLFGGQQSQGGGLFGQQSQGGGLFGGGQQSQSGMFGGGGLFGK